MAKQKSQTTRLTKKAEQQTVVNPVTISVLGHRQSQTTRVMEMYGVTSIVRIRLLTATDNHPRGATYDQLEALDSYIHNEVLCRIPFRCGHGMSIYCRCDETFSDACTLNSYQAVLDAVFGTETRRHARIYHLNLN